MVVALGLGVSTLAGCAAVVAGGDAPPPGWTEGAGRGLELPFTEPVDLALGTTVPDLSREPASSTDLLIHPDFDPTIDAAPLGQEVIEAGGAPEDEGREVATDVFDDPLMTDDGVLSLKGAEEASPVGVEAAGFPWPRAGRGLTPAPPLPAGPCPPSIPGTRPRRSTRR